MVPASLLGGRRASEAPLDLVVAPRFQAGAEPRWERLESARAVMTLAENSCSLPRLGARGLDWIIALARRVPVYRLVFRDLGEALDAIECGLVGKTTRYSTAAAELRAPPQ